MYEVIRSRIEMAAKEDKVKVLLVYGSGGNFSAGNDVNSFLADEPPNPAYVANMLFENASFDKPIYFFVQGCCVGVITTMVAFADFVYCSEDAYFFFPFMSLNLVPEGMSTIKFPELLGRRKANEMFFLEHRLTAKEALHHGFINGILTGDQVPKTEPIITEIDKLPGMRKLLSIELVTL